MAYLHRYLEEPIRNDLAAKMVFIGGPRQTGKTTMARRIAEQCGDYTYLNWDRRPDRESIIRETFPAKAGVLVLDEVHKYGNWRQVVKGLYDTRGESLKIIVTGSARLDYYRRGGDSLQGRYHYHRLLPITLTELPSPTQSDLERLYRYGGFPEPFLKTDEVFTRRWSKEYRSRVIEEDLNGLEMVKDISLLEHLALRLPDLVGSPLSLNSLRGDLGVSHQTIQRWVTILERLYAVFRIYPFGAPAIRAVKKEAKHYHFDWNQVGDRGARFENLVAVHLLKWCWFRNDSLGYDTELCYVRDTDGREVDFAIVENGKPMAFIECKYADRQPSKSLRYVKSKFPGIPATQVCFEECDDYINRDGIRVCPAVVLLREFAVPDVSPTGAS